MLAILPLSPVREWATSRNFMDLHLLVHNMKLNIVGWKKDGSYGNHLSHLDSHPTSSRRTIGIERFHLVANVLRICTCGRSCSDAEANFRDISPVFGNGLGKCIVVQRIDSNVIEAQFLYRHAQHGKALLNNFSCQMCSLVRPGSTIADFPLDEEAVLVANAGFIGATPGFPSSTAHLNHVGSHFFHHDLGKIGNHIGGEVVA